MFAGIGSYLWGGSAATAETTPATSVQRKKKLLETEVTGSDGDEWVLINEGVKSSSPSHKNGSSPSGSPKAKKSRSRKSATPSKVFVVTGSTGTGAVSGPVGAANLQFVSVKKAPTGKIHRRRLTSVGSEEEAIVSEGDKLLHEIERGDFPTIEEGLSEGSGTGSRSWSGCGKRDARGKSYADIAKKLPAVTASDTADASRTQSATATTTVTATAKGRTLSESSCEDMQQHEEAVARDVGATARTPVAWHSRPAVIDVSSASQFPYHSSSPSSSSSSSVKAAKAGGAKKRKEKRTLRLHGLQGQMEGSWFVTPPPCFTLPNTFDLTSSPLEDMLIEKPVIQSALPVLPTHDSHHEDEDGEDEVLLSPVHSSPSLMITSLTAGSSSAPSPAFPPLTFPFLTDSQSERAEAPDTESCNDSQQDNEDAGDEAAATAAANEQQARESTDDEQEPGEEEEDTASLTTSLSSMMNDDHVDDHDETECVQARGRKRGRRPLPAGSSSSNNNSLIPSADSSLTEVQLNSYRILSRKERKGRNAQKRRNRQKKQAAAAAAEDSDLENRDEMLGRRSASAERLVSAIRSLAYEPVRQSKAMQEHTHTHFLKSSFLDRNNHVIHQHHHSKHASARKNKYAARPHTFCTNRKTNRNC